MAVGLGIGRVFGHIEVAVVLVGDGQSGQRCTLNKLMSKRFPYDSSTDGVHRAVSALQTV